MLKKGARAFGPAILIALLLGISTVFPSRVSLAGARSSEQAPAFTLKLLDGKVLNSKALRGHPVVLRFLASW